MRIAIGCLVLLTACGGSPPPEERREGGTLFESSGGESRDAAPDPISTGPAPLPLPTPPVPRGAMSPALQGMWTRAEEVLAEAPPAPPESDDDGSWANTVLAPWLRGRTAAIDDLGERMPSLSSEPLHERAVAAAIFATVVEDMAADVRGAPLPTTISSDPELLTVYRGELDAQLRPIAEQAAAAFQFCAASLDSEGDAAWGEWRAFCFERAEELEEIYGGAVDDGGDD